MLKYLIQGFKGINTQRLKERNRYNLKLSSQYFKTLNKLKPHRLMAHKLRLIRLMLSGAGDEGQGSR